MKKVIGLTFTFGVLYFLKRDKEIKEAVRLKKFLIGE